MTNQPPEDLWSRSLPPGMLPDDATQPLPAVPAVGKPPAARRIQPLALVLAVVGLGAVIAVGVLLRPGGSGPAADPSASPTTSWSPEAPQTGMPISGPTNQPPLVGTPVAQRTPSTGRSASAKPTARATAKPSSRPSGPPSASPSTGPSPLPVVREGDRCSPEGARGVTDKGEPMVCKLVFFKDRWEPA